VKSTVYKPKETNHSWSITHRSFPGACLQERSTEVTQPLGAKPQRDNAARNKGSGVLESRQPWSRGK
jgi:hypothetical protein